METIQIDCQKWIVHMNIMRYKCNIYKYSTHPRGTNGGMVFARIWKDFLLLLLLLLLLIGGIASFNQGLSRSILFPDVLEIFFRQVYYPLQF